MSEVAQAEQSGSSAMLRGQLTIAEDALRAIAAPDCMVSHDDGGGWIDTEAPARIAEGALERIRQHERDFRS